MKFMALVKKELRECLPWLILAAVILTFFGTIDLRSIARFQEDYGYQYDYWHEDPGSTVRSYLIANFPPIDGIGMLLFITSIGLGLVLAGRQFWMPGFTRTWAFTIHRSVSRATILWAKLAAAVIAFVISLGVIWTLFYLYALQPDILPYPPRTRILFEGWIFVILGLLVYFGGVLSGLSSARWYTTKIVGVAFAVFVMVLAMMQPRLLYCLVIIAAGMVILLCQIIHTFLNKEF